MTTSQRIRLTEAKQRLNDALTVFDEDSEKVKECLQEVIDILREVLEN